MAEFSIALVEQIAFLECVVIISFDQTFENLNKRKKWMIATAKEYGWTGYKVALLYSYFSNITTLEMAVEKLKELKELQEYQRQQQSALGKSLK